MKDYYQTLGVAKDAAQDEIKKAYRKLALLYHPDRAETGDEEKFKEISEAYSVVGDEQKRYQYDNPSPFDNLDRAAQHADFEQMFNNMFRSQQSQQNFGHIHPDIEVQTTITLKELYTGTKKELSFVRLTHCEKCNGAGGATTVCTTCKGSGQIQKRHGPILFSTPCTACRAQGRSVDKTKLCTACEGNGYTSANVTHSFEIPAGAGSLNQNVILNAAGLGNKIGKHVGSLSLFVQVVPEPNYSQQGLNLNYVHEILYSDLCLGGPVTIKLLDDSIISLKIPPGTDLYGIQRIKQKGISSVNTNQKGDLLVSFKITIPKNMTPEQETILQAIRKLGL